MTDNVPVQERWSVMSRKFPDDPRLDTTVIYALPQRLLDQINVFAPKLLSPRDLHFERLLRKLAGTGFRNQQPFACELLEPEPTSEVGIELYGQPVDQLFRRVRVEVHGERTSTPEGQIIDLKEIRNRRIQQSAELLRGFAGWLVTNGAYRQEVRKIEKEWLGWPDRVSDFPDLESSTSHVGVSPRRLHDAGKIVGRARRFLRKWNLVRLQTWDIPVPISPIEITDDPLPRNEMDSMGVSLFIPWSFLAFQGLKLRDLVDYHYSRRDRPQLDAWTCAGRQDSRGVDRHSKMFQIFVYLECALKRRYPHQLRGNLRKLDMAFRAFWGPATADEDALKAAAETVRKIREEMQRRLRIIDSTVNG